MPRISPSQPAESAGLPPEDELVALLTRNLPQTARTLTGPGDDCAVIRIPGSPLLQLLKADAMVEGVHFTREMSPAAVGRKALARCVSDIASMAGTPREALVTVILPPGIPLNWIREVYRGMKKAARQWGVGIAGGETSSAPAGSPVVLAITLTGEVPENQVIRRGGARAGDAIVVTGKLGNSFQSGWHLKFTPRLAEAQWLAENFPPTSMMDLSDGLAKDLPRLADASGTGWNLELESLPMRDGAGTAQALGDGEDYELLFTLPGGAWMELKAAWGQRFPRTCLTRIGHVTGKKIRRPALAGGWDHFNGP